MGKRVYTVFLTVSDIVLDTVPVLMLHSCSLTCQLGWCQQRGSFHLGHHNFAEFHDRFSLLSNYAAAVYVSMLLTNLMPRPHPLMRKGGLVSQVEFLGLVCALKLV